MAIKNPALVPGLPDTRDLPAISASNYGSSSYSPLMSVGQAVGLQGWPGHKLDASTLLLRDQVLNAPDEKWARDKGAYHLNKHHLPSEEEIAAYKPKQEPAIVTQPRRLVQVIIADPHPDVPLEDCVLHQGLPEVTDLDDRELFFQLDMKTMLEAYNKHRITLLDRAKSNDRITRLEPAKIRDLKMVVVTIAVLS